MQILAQKLKAVQQTASNKHGSPSRTHSRQSRQVKAILHTHRTIGNRITQPLPESNGEEFQAGSTAAAMQHFSDGSDRTPGSSHGGPSARFDRAQTAASGEGETARPETEIETEGMNLIGEAEYPVDFVGPLPAGDTRAVPHDFVGPLPQGVARSSSFHPTITVVTPGTRRSDCGGYTYKVRWGIPASENTAAGWIVQKVDKEFEATDCDGNSVAPTSFDDPSNYPFWEAWEFTAGQNVWVGPAANGSRHSGDTFSGSSYGNGTKGKKKVKGEVKAIIGFTLPAGMTVRNAAPAWALPYTQSEPSQFANTLQGASHTLTAEWDCCPDGTVTKATTVSTVP